MPKAGALNMRRNLSAAGLPQHPLGGPGSLAPPGSVAAPGISYTAINVQNPGDKPIVSEKKVAIAPPSEKAGRVSKFFDTRAGWAWWLRGGCQRVTANRVRGCLRGPPSGRWGSWESSRGGGGRGRRDRDQGAGIARRTR